MRQRQHTARGHASRGPIPERLIEPRPVTVAPFGWLSRTYAPDGLVVRTTERSGVSVRA